MSALSTTTSLIVHALAWALVHTLWQGAAIAVLVYIPLKAFPRLNSRVKYYLSFGALATIAAWFTDTWVRQYSLLQGTLVYVSTHSEGGESATYTVHTVSRPEVHPGIIHSLTHIVESNTTAICYCYLAGLAIMLARFLVDIIQVRELRVNSLLPLAPKYHALLDDCRRSLDIARPVRMYLSNRVNVPMMLGAVKPVILLPLATINHLTTEQVEAILLHELAHIKRHDYLLNIVQTIMETVLFFNPFVWLLSATARKEREHCCDDLVIAASADPLPYAKALTILEQERVNNNNLALAASGNKHQLFNRIKRIMEMKKSDNRYGHLSIIAVAIIIITLTAGLFTFSTSFAQKAKTPKSDTVVHKSVYKMKKITIDGNGHKKVVEKVSDKPIKEMDDDDINKAMVKVSITSDDSALGNANGVKTYTKIIADPSGNQRVIRTRIVKNGGEEEIVDKSDTDLYIDMKNMAIDLKDMAKSLADANVDINMVNWGDLDRILEEKLSILDKATAETIEKEVKAELENSRKAIKEAQKEIEKAGDRHVTHLVKDKEMNEREIAEAKRAIERSKKDIERSERDIERSKRDLERGQRDLERSKADMRRGDMDMKRSARVMDESGKGMSAYNTMLAEMEKDGLIKRSGDFLIVKNNDGLYIDEKKQPMEVYKKYAPYLVGQKVLLKNNIGERVTTVTE